MPLSALSAFPLLASLVLSYRANPGTVYVAADSRLTPTAANSTRPATDTTCKIRVLNNGVVFVGTGNALFSADRVRTNIYTVAAQEAARIRPGPLYPGDLRSLAFAWQATVHARLQTAIAESGPLTDAAAISTTGTTGSFYAAAVGGEVYGITVRVGADSAGRLQDIEEPQAQVGYLIATGTNEAKEEALAAAPRYTRLPWPGRLQAIEAATIRMEAERYGRNADIGGPVDVIKITAKGPVWLVRKAACR